MNFQDIKIKVFFFVAAYIAFLFLFASDLNPLSAQIFSGHDETQPARIAQFTLNIQNGNIPPRIAPDFSFGLGYPVFTFYAPFSYWVTSLLDLAGFDIMTALKLSYLGALTVAYIGFFLFVKRFFSFYPSLLAAMAYISSPHIAVEIFVRSNLAEIWFFALFPLALYLLLINKKNILLMTTLVLSFLFTTHNILSLLSIVLVSSYALLTKNKRLNLLSIILALLLSAYFYIPLFTELSFVHASEIAKQTNFQDHFLCASQIWTSLWGFAGSAKGCELDGMSFMLGKLHIMMGSLGIGLFFFQLLKKRESKMLNRYFLAFVLLTVGSIFLTLEQSSFLWNIFGSAVGVIQFPWRLLLFGVFGLSFFVGYAANYGKKYSAYLSLGALIVFLIFNSKFFYGQMMTYQEFTKKTLSREYIRDTVAYRVPEYLPTSADFSKWKSLEGSQISFNPFVVKQGKQEVLELENKPFSKHFMIKSSKPATLQIHYAPYWLITKNYIPLIPEKFDTLGRPIIQVADKEHDAIRVLYQETLMERIANLISFLTILSLCVFTFYRFKPSWKSLTITVKKI